MSDDYIGWDEDEDEDPGPEPVHVDPQDSEIHQGPPPPAATPQRSAPAAMVPVRPAGAPDGGVSLPGLLGGEDAEGAEKKILTMIRALGNVRTAAIGQTPPLGWLLMKAKSGEPFAIPTRPATEVLKHFYGISIFNVRPCEADGRPVPTITQGMTLERKGYNGTIIPPTPYIQGELWGDGFCALLQTRVDGVRGVRRTTEKFIGRDDQDQDFAESVVSSLHSKIVRRLSGIVRLDVATVAKCMGLTEEEFTRRAVKGAGYGTAGDRQAAQAVGSDTDRPINAAQAEQSWSEFWIGALKDYNGDENAAWAAIREAGTFTKDGKTVVPSGPEKIANSPNWFANTKRNYAKKHGGKK